jgi:hypothetical protein
VIRLNNQSVQIIIGPKGRADRVRHAQADHGLMRRVLR